VSNTAEAWWIGNAAEESSPENQRSVADYALNVADEHSRPLLELGTPISMAGANGGFLRDVADRDYADLRSGGGVFPFGHRPAFIIDALTAALTRVDIGDWQLPSPLRTELARALSSTMLDGSWQWRFFTSGSEGNDFALRTAMLATGRKRLVGLHGGYHGHTGLTVTMTDARFLSSEYPRLAAEVVRLRVGDTAALTGEIDHRVAAVILEPVQLTDGVRPLEVSYLRALRKRCDEVGALLVFDEVKCGLGRCGLIWAHHRAGVLPDILVAGKALSGGIYPVTAVGVSVDERCTALHGYRHDARSSFGGSHLGMEVGKAALAELTSMARSGQLERKGREFEDELTAAFGRIPGWVPGLLRCGLAFEIELGDDMLALFVAADLLYKKVVVPFPRSSALVLLPPLVISSELMRHSASEISQSIASGRALLY
jgi:putrescine aminotransferase